MKKRNIEFLAKKKKLRGLKKGQGIIVNNIKHIHVFKKDDVVRIVHDGVDFGEKWVNCERLRDRLHQTVPVQDVLIKE
ncbi:TPA: hypothetical protein ACORDH_002836 [Bacillus cereus]|uniref:hypothetical protein n=1 Tax=Bacillus sp. ISTL8 TaxID=2596896 RepID=UPI00145631CF|nr:hypothetical protein [Bacillus sp. ISTL8]